MSSKPDVFADSVLKGFPPPSALLAAHQVEKTTFIKHSNSIFFRKHFFTCLKEIYVFSNFFSRSIKISTFFQLQILKRNVKACKFGFFQFLKRRINFWQKRNVKNQISIFIIFKGMYA